MVGEKNGNSGKYYINTQTFRFEGKYEDGVKVGEWKFYDKLGNLLKTEFWSEGKFIREKIPILRKVLKLVSKNQVLVWCTLIAVFLYFIFFQ